jgi:threonine synthase
MQNFKAWFKCSKGCDVTYSLNEIVYECEKCGSLLEVQHDLDALASRTPEEWKQLFSRRLSKLEKPFRSGIWDKKEWVLPGVEDENIITLQEGRTPLLQPDRFAGELGLEDLHVKLCGNSHSGSFKDLGMTVLVSMVNQMRADGINVPAVACASTGDTSAALAAYCAAAGIQSIVILPRGKISVAQLIQPISNNAITLALDTDFDGCMRIVSRLCREENIYLANSMNSLRIEGQKTISYELAQEFDWEPIDNIIIPGGNLGNVSALGKGFRELREVGLIDWKPRIICAQAQQANPLYKSYQNGFESFEPVKAKKTQASAIQIGDPVSINKAIDVLKEFNGIVEQASEDELANAAARADQAGLFSCPHTGVALAVLTKLTGNKTIQPKQRTVVISTANGLKFTDFKVDYHRGNLEDIESRHLNEPIECPDDYETVKNKLLAELGQR